jgi:hypothetical protein
MKEKEKKMENCHLLITAVVPTGAVIKIGEGEFKPKGGRFPGKDGTLG